MSQKRRDFIKRTVWSGLASFMGTSILTSSPRTEGIRLPSINDWSSVRDQFLLDRNLKFFNTGSLGASPVSVIKAYEEWTRKLELTAETGHGHVKSCREIIARYFNCSTEELAITRNTTEGINIVANGLPLKAGDEVILTTHEHVGCAVPWMNLAQKLGIEIKLVDLDLSGVNNTELLLSALTSRTKVVCFSHVTCTTGMVLNVPEITKACRNKGIYTCVDGAQAPGMLQVDLGALDPDFYATSGHKWLFGPKGTGVLYINKKIMADLAPTFAGAYTTEAYDLNSLTYTYRQVAEREEYGTRNTPLALALKEAFNFQMELGPAVIEAHGRNLAAGLRSRLKPLKSLEIISPEEPGFSSAMVTLRAKNIGYQELQKQLMQEYKCRVRGIYENGLNAIRISCALYNSEGEIDYLTRSITKILS